MNKLYPAAVGNSYQVSYLLLSVTCLERRTEASLLSLEASLNSFIPLPRPLINSGILRPPNNNSTTIIINRICGIPIINVKTKAFITYLD